MPTSPAVLQSSLERHNATFESLLKLIPPKYYIVNDGPNDQARAFFTDLCFSLSLTIELGYSPGIQVSEEQ